MEKWKWWWVCGGGGAGGEQGLIRFWSASALPWAERDAVAVATEPCPVPFEMSRAGAERALPPPHKSSSLISKAAGLPNAHIMTPQCSGKAVGVGVREPACKTAQSGEVVLRFVRDP